MKKLLAIFMSVLFFTHSVCYQSAKAMMGCSSAGDSRGVLAEVNPDELKRNIVEATKRMKSSDVPRLGMALDLRGEVAIVGDLHGDSKYTRAVSEHLQNWLAGSADRKVLFLGDIFDRGDSTTLTLDILLKFYLRNPGRVFILKGNHETENTFGRYNAKDEEFMRTNKDIIKEYFKALPYAAVINNTTFASHAGIPSLRFPQSVVGGREIKSPDDWKTFFTEKEENPEYRVFWEYAVLWPDFIKQASVKASEQQAGLKDGRMPYAKDDLQNFFLEANAIEFPNGRRLNLHHMVAGHNHSMGPYDMENVGEGQTFTFVISSVYYYETFLKNLFISQYSQQEWIDYCSTPEQREKFTQIGCVLVVDGENQPGVLFNRNTLHPPKRLVRVREMVESADKESKAAKVNKCSKKCEENMATEVLKITSSNVNKMSSIVVNGKSKCDFDDVSVTFTNEYNKASAVRMDRLPLGYASVIGDFNSAYMLIKIGAEINGQDAQGNTALHYAVMDDKLDVCMVNLLLEKGADPKIKNKDGKSAYDCANELIKSYINTWPNLCDAVPKKEEDSCPANVQFEEQRKKERTELYDKIRCKEDCEDYRRRLNLEPGTTLGKRNYSGNKAEEVFEITRENVNFMCFISYNIPGKCKIDKDKVSFKCEYDIDWAVGRIQILPLSYATMSDSREGIEMLLKMGANINERDVCDENTALHHAVLRSEVDIDTIKLLLENGADPTIENNNGMTVLSCTDGQLHDYIEKYLELRKAQNEGQDKKIVARRQKEVDGVYGELVQFERRKIEEERRHSEAIKKSKEEERKQAEMEEKKRKAEAERQKAEIEEKKREEEKKRKEEEERKAQEIRERDASIKSARESGLSVESNEITSENINNPIMIIQNWSLECDLAGGKVCLINKGKMERASTPVSMLPLGCAAFIGDIDFVYKCIAMKAKVNGQDELGNTALHYAAMAGNRDIIKVLLAHGARIDIKNKRGKTAIDVAKKGFADFITKYYQDVVIIQDTCITPENVNEMIYLYPDDVDYFQYKGKASGELPVFDQGILLERCARPTRPLIYAACKGDVDFVKRLIELGADVNGQDNNGNTALHIAFAKDEAEIAELLIENGANDGIRNNEGKTVWDCIEK